MSDTLYPTQLTMYGDVGDGMCLSTKGGVVYSDGRNAIKIKICIDQSGYSKEQIAKCINEIFQKVLQYYE